VTLTQKPSAPSRGEIVVTAIKSGLRAGALVPGTRLTERDVCDRYDVSRTTAREALRALSAEGLVVLTPNAGAEVAALSGDEAAQIYLARAALEGLLAASFVVNSTSAQLREALEWVEGFRRAVTAHDVPGMVEAVGRFYAVLARGASSAVLERQLDALYLRTTALRMTSLAQPGRAELSLAEIDELCAALEKRDAGAAREAAMRHVLNAGSVGLAALEVADGRVIASFEATARALREARENISNPSVGNVQ